MTKARLAAGDRFQVRSTRFESFEVPESTTVSHDTERDADADASGDEQFSAAHDVSGL